MKKEIKIAPIENGTVIDHIAAGQALNVLKILGINKQTDTVVSVVMNVRSVKWNTKDIVMVQDRELSSNEVNKIALIAPNATINIIRNSERADKHKVHLPETIKGIIRCANPNCISNAEREPVIPEFTVLKGDPPKFRRVYCERIIGNIGDAIFS